MMLDLPQPLGPTTPTNWPGSMKLVGSAKDLNPESLMELRRTALPGDADEKGSAGEAGDSGTDDTVLPPGGPASPRRAAGTDACNQA